MSSSPWEEDHPCIARDKSCFFPELHHLESFKKRATVELVFDIFTNFRESGEVAQMKAPLMGISNHPWKAKKSWLIPKLLPVEKKYIDSQVKICRRFNDRSWKKFILKVIQPAGRGSSLSEDLNKRQRGWRGELRPGCKGRSNNAFKL